MTEEEMSSKVSSQVREEYRFESRRLGLSGEGGPRDGTAWESQTPWKRVPDGLEQPRQAEPRSPSLLHLGLLGRERPSREDEGLLRSQDLTSHGEREPSVRRAVWNCCYGLSGSPQHLYVETLAS